MTDLGRETHQTRPPARVETLEDGMGFPVEVVRAPQDVTAEDIERRFTYHRPEGKKITEHDVARAAYKAWAHVLAEILPAGREKSLAITALEESSMWAHAAIAREGK